MGQGAVGDRLGPIKVFSSPVGLLTLAFHSDFRLGIWNFDRLPVPTEMPFPDACRGVALLLQHLRQGQLVSVEDRLA